MSLLERAALAMFSAACLAVACTDRPPSTDAGPDPDISDCCLYFVLPLVYDDPHVCLCDHTAPGETRWLTCLGGLVEYSCRKPSEEP